MGRVRLTVPATSANLGPGFDTLGLALGLRNIVELETAGQGLDVEIIGEGEAALAHDANNLTVKAVYRVFEKVGAPIQPLKFRLTNTIPPASGMGSSAAATVGGLVAANTLLDNALSRDELLAMAADMEGHPDNACAAMLGGLVIASGGSEGLIYQRVRIAPMQVAIALPDVHVMTEDLRALLPKTVTLADAAFNIGRAALVIQALAEGDYDLLGDAMHDRLHEPYRKSAIPGYNQAVRAALEAGASAVAISGSGPALIAFAPQNHAAIMRAMSDAFARVTERRVKTWTLPVDTQGVQVET